MYAVITSYSPTATYLLTRAALSWVYRGTGTTGATTATATVTVTVTATVTATATATGGTRGSLFQEGGEGGKGTTAGWVAGTFVEDHATFFPFSFLLLFNFEIDGIT